MALIFSSMSGEGRGHATRAMAVADALRAEGHRVAFFAPGDAYELLADAYRDSTDVAVERIPGLRFHYNDRRRLDYVRTAREAAAYMARANGLIGRLADRIRADKPDLILTDFEPSLPRAARRAGVPFISCNHQHFLIVSDLSSLPPRVRRETFLMRQVVKSYYSGQIETIVSSFYFPPLKPEWQGRCTQVGVLMRPEVLAAEQRDGGHLTAYIRRFAPEPLLEALATCGRPVRLYGLGAHPPRGGIRFCAVDAQAFVRDLASGTALICTAGNQLVGEALWFRKPVLSMPEANNWEQYINAHYLRESGGGDWVELESAGAPELAAFLEKVDHYRGRIDTAGLNGNDLALAAIRRHL